MCVALACVPGALEAQLISPGPLSSAHADLEGITNCTKCHELGTKGIANARCLACHTTLDARITAKAGFHASLASKNCAECHKEHFGRTFDVVRFDTTGFDHAAKTGYALQASHATLACRKCHAPDRIADSTVRRFAERGGARGLQRTFLGLATTCHGCHDVDNPHGRQFGTKKCSDCHQQRTWKQAARFDHAATRFPLTGQHADVKCDACHRPANAAVPASRVYVGVKFGACADCHRDPHGGAMGATCERCHTTAGWKNMNRADFERRFDHARTGFRLTGLHATLACATCHDASRRWPDTAFVAMTYPATERGHTYARPVARNCRSCHRDPHDGAMGETCETCHTTDGWKNMNQADFERRFDHSRTGYRLAGAHATLACASCHDAARLWPDTAFIAMTYPASERGHTYPRPVARDCLSCHRDYHTGAFKTSGGAVCSNCHAPTAWLPTSFDVARHAKTSFPLEGAHVAVPCLDCHRTATGALRFTMDHGTCESCHASTNPHGTQFADRTCTDCHTIASFRITAFDHSRTRFPLDGRHRSVACNACHVKRMQPNGVAIRIYRSLGTECRDCHGSHR